MDSPITFKSKSSFFSYLFCLFSLTESILISQTCNAQTQSVSNLFLANQETLLAQTNPPPDPLTPTPKPESLPKPVELIVPPTSTPNTQEEIPANLETEITVKQFRFVGSSVFSQQELNQVLQAYLDRPISFSELLQARSDITQYYIDRGYLTSGAYLPPQTIEEGIVTINIVEGGLAEINVAVEGKLTPNYIRDRLNLAAGKPLNVDRLLEALQLLQLNPIIEGISAELSSGTDPGSNILDVEVKVGKTFTPEIIVDNGRNPQVGSIRRGFQLEDRSLFGYGDTARLWYLNSNGTNDVNVAYNIPVNAANGELGLGYRYVSAEIVEDPFSSLDIDSDYQKYSLSFRQPVWQTPTQEFSLGLAFDHQTSQSRLGEFGGFPFAGTDNRGRTKISTLRFSQEWLNRDEMQVFSARSEFSLGVDWFDTTTAFDAGVNSNAPESNYFLWRGQSQWVRELAPNTLLVMRGDIQIADRPLVSLEQFGLGGLGSITGYRQNFLLTDNGVFASAEVAFPIYDQAEHLVQLIPFVNVGRGWNAGSSPDPEKQTLASAGLGLQWQYSDRISARIDWGIPIVPVSKRGNTLQDNGIIFSVIVRPF